MKPLARDMHDAPSSVRPDMDSSPVARRPDGADGVGALLDFVTRRPPRASTRDHATALLDVLAGVLPSHAVGVCLPGHEGEPPFVSVRLPDGVSAPERDPIRLFPALAHEQIEPVDGLDGATLHVASPGAPASTETSTLVRRAAQVLAHVVAAKAPDADALWSQLVQAEKLATLGQLVASVVHELANPVTSIVASADYLRRRQDCRTAPEVAAHLDRMGMAADRLLTFSRDLVAYARPASGTPTPVAIHEVVSHARGFSQHELDRHQVEFSEDYSAGAPAVLGQAGPLTQVFVNLFVNAAQAMRETGGQLQVRTGTTEDTSRLTIEVTDTGTGIPTAALPRVFEPFFTTKPAGQGTGLGLAIVKEIVAAHGGTVEVASTLGEGTTFRLTLPLCGTKGE